jgi:autotransporter translocation and assembly factor TamB
MSLDTSFVKLIQLRVRSDKGELNLNGQLNFTREMITNATASLNAKDFLLVHNRNMELRFNANITGAGDEQGPRYRGDYIVERSRFFLPALQQRSVIQLNEAEANPAAADSAQSAIVSSADVTPLQQWLQKLRGEVKISIPRNTWIRGPELNAEIDGAIDFIQEGMEKFSLFGTHYLVRGTYELFGKRFDIDKGQITFQGDLENPQFDLTASHVFRAATGDREKKTLEVKISGDLTNPKIEFQQSGESLDEKDALANLIFGVNFEDLVYSQREGLTNEDSPLSAAAKGLVSGLVSQELAKSLGRSLNLDLIEFQSGEDITKSSVLVGKYLTNDLFISFGQEPEGRVVALEWELLKFLFLQAAHGGEENRKTGFDLIWKWDW